MKQIELFIKVLSALAIGRQKPGGSVSEAENYIPGTVIRGTIACQILQESGHNNANLSDNGGDFQALFLGESPAVFHNGYPSVAKVNKDESKVVTNEVLVLPSTAVSSKTESGFKPSGNGVFDTLIDRFCAEIFNYPYDPKDPKSLEEGTDARVEPYSGFYSNNKEYYSHSVSTRFLTRVGINRKRATSEESILYSIEVLNESFSTNKKSKTWENVVYRSAIQVEDDLAKKLEEFINSKTFRLGGSASRGLGKVEITAKVADLNKGVEARFKKFNDKLKSRFQLWSSLFGNSNQNLEDRVYFTLDLQSDTILSQNWRRTTVISEAMLQQFTNVEDNSLKLEAAYSSYDYISGWNSAWGLMKNIELVTNKGAVYLFSTVKDREKEWINGLQELELNGMGEKTCEGFGKVKVCNDFHLILREEAV